MTRTPHAPALTFAFALAMLVVASPTVAKDKKPVDPNKKVCRSQTDTGSIMPKSTCHTTAEWAQIDAGNNAAAQSTLDRSSRNGTPH